MAVEISLQPIRGHCLCPKILSVPLVYTGIMETLPGHCWRGTSSLFVPELYPHHFFLAHPESDPNRRAVRCYCPPPVQKDRRRGLFLLSSNSVSGFGLLQRSRPGHLSWGILLCTGLPDKKKGLSSIPAQYGCLQCGLVRHLMCSVKTKMYKEEKK